MGTIKINSLVSNPKIKCNLCQCDAKSVIDFVNCRAIYLCHNCVDELKDKLVNYFKSDAEKLVFNVHEIIDLLQKGKLDLYDCIELENGRMIEINQLFAKDIRKQDFIHLFIQDNKSVKLKIIPLVSFDEARTSGKRFTYKSWDEYYNLGEALKKLSMEFDGKIEKMLSEISWKIEPEVIIKEISKE